MKRKMMAIRKEVGVQEQGGVMMRESNKVQGNSQMLNKEHDQLALLCLVFNQSFNICNFIIQITFIKSPKDLSTIKHLSYLYLPNF